MFKNKLKGKIFIVFSDPGGAKPCLAIGDTIEAENICIVSDRNYPFYTQFSSNVNVIQSEEDLEFFIDQFNPDVIFTGTSYTSIIEKKALKIAKEKSIVSFSFVDHWTSIADRFRTDDGIFNFPNEVWVLDERAKEIAIKDGISEDKIIISGNPYHYWLKNWKPDIDREIFFNNLKLDSTKKYILFAPDPLSNIDGLQKYGFDEYTASRNIVECVNNAAPEFKKRYHFLVKMHPNQSSKELLEIFEMTNNFTVLPLDIDTNQSIYFSDIIIGFFSSLLIEANIMNKLILRFLEKKLLDDPFLGLDLGVKTNGDNLIEDILKQA
ncbi:CDP-glycerol glycerophosphotransferase family protein [Flavobacterium tructae]|uniref:CDP-glycerol glycerophosphotransferase family protein n=1 Tax=Flavobacterium tructae TaxID=1114873 RepID=UPI002551FFD9|nr:CDP-glycerol glycerophosphotransferase family protein [Flavobacterium tructae]MDL2143321.1 CDP-glycerol glycerophosphotransferase family protein [Flavobacterium tructae]